MPINEQGEWVPSKSVADIRAERTARGLGQNLASTVPYTTSNVQPSFLDRFKSTFTGASPYKYATGVQGSQLGYIDKNGDYAFTGNLDKEALDTADIMKSSNPAIFGAAGQTGTGLAGSLAGTLDGIGGAKGLADIGSGLASLYGIYSGMQQNKRAEDAWNMQKGEHMRSVQKDKDFATNLNKSGLGTYSAGM